MIKNHMEVWEQDDGTKWTVEAESNEKRRKNENKEISKGGSKASGTDPEKDRKVHVPCGQKGEANDGWSPKTEMNSSQSSGNRRTNNHTKPRERRCPVNPEMGLDIN